MFCTWLVASCEECLDPFESGPSAAIRSKAKLTSDTYLANRNHSDVLIFSDFVGVYTLCESLLVEYVLLGHGGDFVALQLKEAYNWNVNRSFTLSNGIQFGEFNDIPDNDESVRGGERALPPGGLAERTRKNRRFLNNHSSRDTRCYTMYSAFNYMVNYSSLMKIYKERRRIMFIALTQSLTNCRILPVTKRENVFRSLHKNDPHGRQN